MESVYLLNIRIGYTKLSWQCEKGHIRMSPNTVKNTESGVQYVV